MSWAKVMTRRPVVVRAVEATLKALSEASIRPGAVRADAVEDPAQAALGAAQVGRWAVPEQPAQGVLAPRLLGLAVAHRAAF